MPVGRLNIGLYNSYDPVNFAEAHRRALARVGPVALWLDCNLFTIGFPFPKETRTPAEIADWIGESTSIGKEGRYLIELAKQGRFNIIDFPDKGFPPQLGEIVLMTSHPEPDKAVEPQFVADTLQRGKSVCILIGLGPRGVPKKIFEIVRQHVDITGKGYPLETCTAIGAIPAVIMGLAKRI